MAVNIRPITGNWDAGFALDKHTVSSTPIGHNTNGYMMFDTVRTDVGEALYQLKYQSDYKQVDRLARGIANHLIPLFEPIGFIIPMPSTQPRPRQPVLEVTRALAKIIDLPVIDTLLVSTGNSNSPSTKDIVDKNQKITTLMDRFAIADVITSEGKWNVLVVDDLFDSGASMEVACTKLRSYPKVGKIFVAALTWK